MVRAKFLLLLVLALSSCLRVESQGGLLVSKLQGRCRVEEREALLDFKQSLFDSQHLLSSWELSEDCCAWKGVGCNNTTGHVIILDFEWSFNDFNWTIVNINRAWWPFYATSLVPSLFRLQHLQFLSLYGIYFNYTSIPQDISSLINLYCLDLHDSGFIGVIPHHLGNMTNLQYLDLSLNSLVTSDFQWMSRLFLLKYLDMSDVNLSLATNWLHDLNMLPLLSILILKGCNLQTHPTSLPYSNFSSNIVMLDLSENHFSNFMFPSWIYNMTNLIELIMSGCQLHGMVPSNILGALCRLRQLDLSNNHLEGNISSMFLGQLPKCNNKYELKELNLAMNHLNGSLPNWLGDFRNLSMLQLQVNNFTGSLSFASLNLFCSLSILYLSENNFTELIDDESALKCNPNKMALIDISDNHLSGSIPKGVGQMINLQLLYLGGNQLSGSIPQSLSQLMNLTTLDLSNNLLQGTLLEVNFTNLSKLKRLYLSNNHLHFNITSLNWIPPFQASILHLSSCFIGPQFPLWLQTQKFLSMLDLSNNGISDIIPNWFWNISSQVVYLNLSHNLIRSKLPISLNLKFIQVLDLGSNLLEGHLPLLTNYITFASFSGNKFSNGIHRYLNANMSFLTTLYLSQNHLSDEIPHSICQSPSIIFLDISHNNLSGEIPKCSGKISSFMMLRFINLAYNNLWGSIPQWIGNLPSLMSLYLSNNNFQGEIPFFKNCSKLVTLDMGQNKLTGNIPLWIGDKLSSLKILRLRSNNFHGAIPSQLSKLKEIQILDLANNFLSGSLPASFRFLNSMTIKNKRIESLNPTEVYFLRQTFSMDRIVSMNIIFIDSLVIAIKGVESEYKSILSLVTTMDLSSNNLTGEVPTELMSLVGLISLNLSRNQFTGHIPINIGAMQGLESLDLSWNNFSGEIPHGIVKLSGLNYLNISYNQLSGRIPMSTQLDTFKESSYFGNPKLCGEPLHKICEGDGHNIHNGESKSYDVGDNDNFGLFLGMGIGFVIGFWSVLGTLLLNRSWEIACHQMYDNIIDNIYVFVVVRVNQWFN